MVASKNEKPLDDIHDYPIDLTPVYRLKLKKMKEPHKAANRVVKRVRGKFERAEARKVRPSKFYLEL